MNKMSEFSERLKELMEDTNSTQDKISKIAGCGRGSISTWLSGQYYPSTKNLLKLSEYFSCSIDFLLGRTENPEVKDFTVVSTFSERLKLLAQISRKSLLKISEELKIDNAILYRWANAKYQPGVQGLELLADYFGCSIDYLIGRNE